MDDFAPARVAEQVAPLKELLDMRNRLTQLMTKMEGNDKLEKLLADVLSNTDQAMALAKEMGIESGAEGAPKEESK
jgi:type VI secretion system protein ImpB